MLEKIKKVLSVIGQVLFFFVALPYLVYKFLIKKPVEHVKLKKRIKETRKEMKEVLKSNEETSKHIDDIYIDFDSEYKSFKKKYKSKS
jgi:hypothetical protein